MTLKKILSLGFLFVMLLLFFDMVPTYGNMFGMFGTSGGGTTPSAVATPTASGRQEVTRTACPKDYLSLGFIRGLTGQMPAISKDPETGKVTATMPAFRDIPIPSGSDREPCLEPSVEIEGRGDSDVFVKIKNNKKYDVVNTNILTITQLSANTNDEEAVIKLMVELWHRETEAQNTASSMFDYMKYQLNTVDLDAAGDTNKERLENWVDRMEPMFNDMTTKDKYLGCLASHGYLDMTQKVENRRNKFEFETNSNSDDLILVTVSQDVTDDKWKGDKALTGYFNSPSDASDGFTRHRVSGKDSTCFVAENLGDPNDHSKTLTIRSDDETRALAVCDQKDYQEIYNALYRSPFYELSTDVYRALKDEFKKQVEAFEREKYGELAELASSIVGENDEAALRPIVENYEKVLDDINKKMTEWTAALGLLYEQRNSSDLSEAERERIDDEIAWLNQKIGALHTRRTELKNSSVQTHLERMGHLRVAKKLKKLRLESEHYSRVRYRTTGMGSKQSLTTAQSNVDRLMRRYENYTVPDATATYEARYNGATYSRRFRRRAARYQRRSRRIWSNYQSRERELYNRYCGMSFGFRRNQVRCQRFHQNRQYRRRRAMRQIRRQQKYYRRWMGRSDRFAGYEAEYKSRVERELERRMEESGWYDDYYEDDDYRYSDYGGDRYLASDDSYYMDEDYESLSFGRNRHWSGSFDFGGRWGGHQPTFRQSQFDPGMQQPGGMQMAGLTSRFAGPGGGNPYDRATTPQMQGWGAQQNYNYRYNTGQFPSYQQDFWTMANYSPLSNKKLKKLAKN